MKQKSFSRRKISKGSCRKSNMRNSSDSSMSSSSVGQELCALRLTFHVIFLFVFVDEMGYKYYIILKGAVFVQIPNKNYSKYDTNSPKVTYPEIKSIHVHSPAMKDHHQSIIKDKSPIDQQQQLRNASELSPSGSSSSSSSSHSDSESPNK